MTRRKARPLWKSLITQYWECRKMLVEVKAQGRIRYVIKLRGSEVAGPASNWEDSGMKKKVGWSNPNYTRTGRQNMGACLSQPGSSSPWIMLSGRKIKWPYALGNEFGIIRKNYCKENKMGKKPKERRELWKVRLPPTWHQGAPWLAAHSLHLWPPCPVLYMDYLKREKLFYPNQ